MASPPYGTLATSPPYPPHIPLPNPKKRPSLSMPSLAPSLKRQKRTSIHSATSALSAHPLRQTSFPPEESAIDTGARSPSMESDFTAVTGGKSVANAGATKRMRGKGKKKPEGSVKSGTREKTVEGAREGTGEAPDDEDEEDEGGEGMVDDGEPDDREAEVKKTAVLTDAFDEQQTERYEAYRRVKMRKETVRKIVNQTVSQSVPPAVITTINGYSKPFMGTLIERAREVQLQWAALETPPTTPPKNIPIDPTDFNAENPNNDVFAAESGGSALADLTMAAQSGTEQVEHASKPKELGPLLPDHFREALRRYKLNGDGGGTGLQGVSVGLGLPGTGSARLRGKRLFR